MKGCRWSKTNTKQTLHQSLTSKTEVPNQASYLVWGTHRFDALSGVAAAVFHGPSSEQVMTHRPCQACRRRHRNARQHHHPTLVHHHASTVRTRCSRSPRDTIVDVPDATPLLLHEHHLLPLVLLPSKTGPNCLHEPPELFAPIAPTHSPRQSHQGGNDAVAPPPPNPKDLGFSPGQGGRWEWGRCTSTSPPRRDPTPATQPMLWPPKGFP